MDLRLVREEAIERTSRFFWDTRGFVPAEDSDEWEAEYRRQFEQAKARHANGAAAPRPAAVQGAAPATARPEQLGNLDRRPDANPVGGLAARRPDTGDP